MSPGTGRRPTTSESTMTDQLTRALGLVPMVVETTGRGERAYDIYSQLLK